MRPNKSISEDVTRIRSRISTLVLLVFVFMIGVYFAIFSIGFPQSP